MGTLQHTDGRRPLALRQYRPNTITGHSKARASMERTRANDGLRPRSRYPHQTPYQFRSKAMSIKQTITSFKLSATWSDGKTEGLAIDLPEYLYDELQAYFRELEDLREEHDNDLRDEEYSFGEDESKAITGDKP
jgi:hypothetical protein